MYAAIWRVLPGPRWFRVIEAVVLGLAVVWGLFTWVFPWMAQSMGLLDTTLA